MRTVLASLLRGMSRYPLTLTVAVAAVGAAIARIAWMSEVELDGAHFTVLSWVLLLAALTAAERAFGSIRTVVIVSIGTSAGVLVAWATLSTAARLGEALSQEAMTSQLWTPSVTTVALLMAVSGTVRPATRQTIRWVVGTAAVALLLVNAHASDVARVLAAGAGLGFAAFWASPVPVASWRPAGRTRWRSVLSAALMVIASALALASVTPHASGVLAATGAVMDSPTTAVAAACLAIGALLTMAGRLIGIVISGATLLVVAVASLNDLVLQPVLTGGFDWSDLTGPDAGWEIVVLLSGLLPGVVVLALALGARTVTRRCAPAPTEAERSRARDVLRSAGSGTFAHMATWAGNSLWFGEDDTVIAYRVRDGVAFTVGDPVSADHASAVRSFARFCETRGWTPVFYSVHDATALALEDAGWARTPVGTDAVVHTESFSLSGRKRQDLRTAVNRARREELSAVWTTLAAVDPGIRSQLHAICAGWAKDKHLPEMGFTLGGLPEMDDPDVRLMLVVGPEGRVHAVTSWLPRFRDGARVGWTLDVMRRARDAMPGAMEFAIVSTIERAKADGLATVSLSGTPLAAHEGAAKGRMSHHLARVLEPAYGFSSLERFKAKFGAEPEALWMCFPQPILLGRIAVALVRTYVPTLRLRGVLSALRA